MLGHGSLRDLAPSSSIGQPIRNLNWRQLSLELQFHLLLFRGVRVLLVTIQPVAEDLDRVSRKADPITLRAARSVVGSDERCIVGQIHERPGILPFRSQGFDACEGAMLGSDILMNVV